MTINGKNSNKLDIEIMSAVTIVIYATRFIVLVLLTFTAWDFSWLFLIRSFEQNKIAGGLNPDDLHSCQPLKPLHYKVFYACVKF